MKEPEDINELLMDTDPLTVESVVLDPNDINRQFVEWSGYAAYWNEQFAKAHEAHSNAKMEREEKEASLMIDPAFIELLEGKIGKKPTVGQLEAAIKLDRGYKVAKIKELRTEAELLRLKGLMGVMHGKRETMISLGASIRDEKKGDPYTRTQ